MRLFVALSHHILPGSNIVNRNNHVIKLPQNLQRARAGAAVHDYTRHDNDNDFNDSQHSSNGKGPEQTDQSLATATAS